MDRTKLGILIGAGAGCLLLVGGVVAVSAVTLLGKTPTTTTTNNDAQVLHEQQLRDAQIRQDKAVADARDAQLGDQIAQQRLRVASQVAAAALLETKATLDHGCAAAQGLVALYQQEEQEYGADPTSKSQAEHLISHAEQLTQTNCGSGS